MKRIIINKNTDRLIVHVLTTEQSLIFLEGQRKYFQQENIKIKVIAAKHAKNLCVNHELEVFYVNLTRNISPLRDLIAIIKITKYLIKEKPAIVHASTPKGGVLGVISAKIASIPLVVYQMRGLKYITNNGVKRKLLKIMEKIACKLSDVVVINSKSLRKWSIEEKLVNVDKAIILGNGSGNGVDCKIKFNPDKIDIAKVLSIKNELHINDCSKVLGYVGRLTRDKGIEDLVLAWETLKDKYDRLLLLLVGYFDENDKLNNYIQRKILLDNRIVLREAQRDNIEIYYSIMDILLLPSYREGFPNCILEASSMRLPVITTDAIGCKDAVVHKSSGIIYPKGDIDKLKKAIELYLNDTELMHKHGNWGRKFVKTNFSNEVVWSALSKLYSQKYAN